MLTAFWATACLQPPTSSPVSSKVGILLEDDLAAFHRVDPQVSSCCIHVHTHFRLTYICIANRSEVPYMYIEGIAVIRNYYTYTYVYTEI